jgi:hypothetical protein
VVSVEERAALTAAELLADLLTDIVGAATRSQILHGSLVSAMIIGNVAATPADGKAAVRRLWCAGCSGPEIRVRQLFGQLPCTLLARKIVEEQRGD